MQDNSPPGIQHTDFPVKIFRQMPAKRHWPRAPCSNFFWDSQRPRETILVHWYSSEYDGVLMCQMCTSVSWGLPLL